MGNYIIIMYCYVTIVRYNYKIIVKYYYVIITSLAIWHVIILSLLQMAKICHNIPIIKYFTLVCLYYYVIITHYHHYYLFPHIWDGATSQMQIHLQHCNQRFPSLLCYGMHKIITI